MQPQPFGMYTLINRVNVGGMAEVFKACYYNGRDPDFAAIKRILPHLAQDQSFINMFIREAKVIGQLKHPNIAQIIEQGEEQGEYFISMEYVSGRDLLYLRHHLRERGLYFPPALAAHVVAQVALALDHAHRCCDERGAHLAIIHRDVSPQNILISYEGEVKLIDFGIAKANSAEEHTRAGVFKGKYGYMSPEQVQSKRFDHRVDIFALGTVFYELLTNTRLFMGDSDIETLELVRNAHVNPPSQVNRFIPPSLDQIVMRALVADPNARYQSAGDLARDLHAFIQSEAPMTHHATLRSWMQQEFATYIAHEKAQDNYLLDQMRESLEDSESEDLESTSLISSDVMDQLHAYAQTELNQEVSEDHTPHEASPQSLSSRMALQGDTSAQGYLGDEENTPITQSTLGDVAGDVAGNIAGDAAGDVAGALSEERLLDHTSELELTTPITAAQLARVEQLASSLDQSKLQAYPEHEGHESFAQPATRRFPSFQENLQTTPAPHVPPPSQLQSTSGDQRLEALFGEALDDSSVASEELESLDALEQFDALEHLDVVEDEDSSALFKFDHDLDQILSMSITKGAQSPLNQQQGASPGFGASIGAPAGAPIHIPSSVTPMSAPQLHVSQPEVSGADLALEPQQPAVIFAEHEPTPPPEEIRSSLGRRKRSSSRGVLWVILSVLLISGGVAVWTLLPPSEVKLQLDLSPLEDSTVQVNFDSPRSASEVTELIVPNEPDKTKITVKHPYLPRWSRFLTQRELELGALEVNLEESAPQRMIHINSNVSGAQVWVLGKLRGNTPFKGKLPTNRRGHLKVTVMYQNRPPVERVLKRQKKMFARF